MTLSPRRLDDYINTDSSLLCRHFLGLISVRQKAKIIIFPLLNFILWQQFYFASKGLSLCHPKLYYKIVWINADEVGDPKNFNAIQMPIKAQINTYNHVIYIFFRNCAI